MADLPPEPRSDEDLLADLRAGDRGVFGELVRRYERELYGYLRRYVGDDDLADDVFQNTFVTVYRKIQQYEVGRPARPWLYTVATRQAIDALRRRNRRSEPRPADPGPNDGGEPRSLFDLLEARDPDPLERADAAEQAAKVRAAVDGLPDFLKQVVVLTYFQGMRYQDAAEVLGVPVGTVKSRLHAAVSRLAAGWGPDSDAGNGARDTGKAAKNTP